VYFYVGGNPVGSIDPLGLFEDVPMRRPPSFFELTTLEALRRDTTLSEAISRGEGSRYVTAPAVMLPQAFGVVGSAGFAGCRIAPEVAREVANVCKNPLLALALGASICGSSKETQTGQRPEGKPPGSARQYSEDRRKLLELRDAAERARQGNPAGLSSLP
jgi:hypothetical protein